VVLASNGETMSGRFSNPAAGRDGDLGSGVGVVAAAGDLGAGQLVASTIVSPPAARRRAAQPPEWKHSPG
jgi:hypothetical protein